MQQGHHLTHSRRKRCLNCNELFDSDPRTKGQQRYCSKDECQAMRQRLNEKDWRLRNPDCVAYQQHQTSQWFKDHPEYSQQRRKDNPDLLIKNRDGTRLRMKKMRHRVMFDKSKSILTQLTGSNTDKCYLTRASGWLMVRLTKASPLSRRGSITDNRYQFKRIVNHLPRGKLYDLSGRK
jgi:hypothetical protein